MRYGLTRGVLDSSSFTVLSEDEYNRLVQGRRNMSLLLSIEDQFDLVLNDYLDFENAILSISTRWMVFLIPDLQDFDKDRNLIVNRKFLNLLNACRAYLDHTSNHIKKIKRSGQIDLTDAFIKYRSEEYDTCFGYRAMEAMRNYIQHAGFPLTIVYSTTRVGGGENEKLRVSAIPYIRVSSLGKSFKANVRKELQKLGQDVDVRLLVRQYVASIGNIYEKLRTQLRPEVEEWEAMIFGAMDRFRKDYPGEEFLGLWAAEEAEDGTWEPKAWISDKATEDRRALQRKNRNLESLARRYVSTESPQE